MAGQEPTKNRYLAVKPDYHRLCTGAGCAQNGNAGIERCERQRITGGVSLTLSKPILAELRVNYEKYFYTNWNLADPSEQDKLVIEIVARF